MRYQIRASESGDVIEEVASKEEAIHLVVCYEKEDGESVGFYEIYDTEKEEIVY